MGMKQLMSLKKYKDASGEDEELALIERMKSTIGVAVGNMETAIKSGALWCPSQEETISDKTPKRRCHEHCSERNTDKVGITCD